MTASITAYSAMSWSSSSCDQRLRKKSVRFAPPRSTSVLAPLTDRMMRRGSLPHVQKAEKGGEQSERSGQNADGHIVRGWGRTIKTRAFDAAQKPVKSALAKRFARRIQAIRFASVRSANTSALLAPDKRCLSRACVTDHFTSTFTRIQGWMQH
jgi:hypothetical protein